VISPATAEAATRYQRTFHGHASQVAQVRRDIAAYLDGCPAADDAILVVSEIATNALVHSRSNGESFTVRSEIFRDYVWIECEDLGGPWQCARPDDRPHGLDVIGAPGRAGQLGNRDNQQPRPDRVGQAAPSPGG
jgi:hypothetical protein